MATRKLADLIREIVAREIADALGGLSDDRDTTDDNAAAGDRAAGSRDAADADESQTEETPRRRRRRRQSRVGYSIVPRRKGAEPLELIPTHAKVYNALRKSSPQTAKDIEKSAGLKKKTVESSLYNLRQMGLVKSSRLE